MLGILGFTACVAAADRDPGPSAAPVRVAVPRVRRDVLSSGLELVVVPTREAFVSVTYVWRASNAIDRSHIGPLMMVLRDDERFARLRSQKSIVEWWDHRETGGRVTVSADASLLDEILSTMSSVLREPRCDDQRLRGMYRASPTMSPGLATFMELATGLPHPTRSTEEVTCAGLARHMSQAFAANRSLLSVAVNAEHSAVAALVETFHWPAPASEVAETEVVRQSAVVALSESEEREEVSLLTGRFVSRAELSQPPGELLLGVWCDMMKARLDALASPLERDCLVADVPGGVVVLVAIHAAGSPESAEALADASVVLGKSNARTDRSFRLQLVQRQLLEWSGPTHIAYDISDRFLRGLAPELETEARQVVEASLEHVEARLTAMFAPETLTVVLIGAPAVTEPIAKRINELAAVQRPIVRRGPTL